jgi:hypothetical protein
MLSEKSREVRISNSKEREIKGDQDRDALFKHCAYRFRDVIEQGEERRLSCNTDDSKNILILLAEFHIHTEVQYG